MATIETLGEGGSQGFCTRRAAKMAWFDPKRKTEKIEDLTPEDLRNPEECTNVGKMYQGIAYEHRINSEAELNAFLKSLSIDTSTGARYHGKGVRYATGLFKAVIERFFEKTNDPERPFRLRQEYIDIIENGGTLIGYPCLVTQ